MTVTAMQNLWSHSRQLEYIEGSILLFSVEINVNKGAVILTILTLRLKKVSREVTAAIAVFKMDTKSWETASINGTKISLNQ